MDDREYELKKSELALKQREVAAREREVATKEKEGQTSKWFNPVTIAIYAAAIGLFGNILTSNANNTASEKAEHLRAQSDLVLQVIKTGNTVDACKNLSFFVNIGLLDDPKGAIHNVCGTKGEGGVPTLPADSGGGGSSDFGDGLLRFGIKPPFGIAATLVVRVEDADSHEPIVNAKISREDSSRSETTDATGTAVLNFISSQTRLTVSKEGYESTTGYPYILSKPSQSSLTIDLHRAPK
jgi:hypothetical protein